MFLLHGWFGNNGFYIPKAGGFLHPKGPKGDFLHPKGPIFTKRLQGIDENFIKNFVKLIFFKLFT